MYQNARGYDPSETEEAWEVRMEAFIRELQSSTAPLIEIPIADGMLPFETTGWIRNDQPRDGSGGYSGHHSVVLLTEKDADRWTDVQEAEWSHRFEDKRFPQTLPDGSIGYWRMGNFLNMNDWPRK